ncbi:hypothetical protein ASD89_11465 [Caulobacter sp. Root656]|nr:hypothetical protein ASD89_11465 [Caulobacter sp. Root656]
MCSARAARIAPAAGDQTAPSAAGPPLWVEAALMGERLAERLSPVASDATEFLSHQARLARKAWSPLTIQPLDRLSKRLSLSPPERGLVVLAGMAEEHEGYCAVFCDLHPKGEARPTIGLFAQLHWPDASRRACLRLLHESVVVRSGLVRVGGVEPWPRRDLSLAPEAWSLLQGLDVRPSDADPGDGPDGPADAAWLGEAGPVRAIAALSADRPCAVLLQGSAAEIRARWLAAASGRPALVATVDAGLALDSLQLLLARALIRDETPVLRLAASPGGGASGPRREIALAIDRHPGPLALLDADTGLVSLLNRPIIAIPGRALPRTAARGAWLAAAPGLARAADDLAARFPAPPATVMRAGRDATFLRERAVTPDDLAEAVKARLGASDGGAARRVTPVAAWDDLVLAPERLRVLRGAADRMRLELRVLDDWGFEASAHGQRGVRLLFAGLPGTGKTLAAEVLAGALGADMLVVDLAGVVSKWIGETEKNLSILFDQAEATRAVLFFDEADALFGKRTEVSDAHDRYANIETSFLLARLDRFDGVAVLATNLRQNLDKAFVRRFDAIIDFPEPGLVEREAIWRRHMPARAPLAADVDLAVLADRYPMSGAMIRNAAIAAAFAAAGETAADPRIALRHLHAAVRLEFDKAGRPHPT